ncbi:MAG TPA: hypothetical protein VEJ44_02350 [Acidimicrobiales bacterium]|nr:hypothetical protein [Acidimicrobiales bacterium]
MTPAQAAAQRAAPVRTARSSRAAAKPPLRVVAPRSRRNGRLLRVVAAALVVGSLLGVVVGHSLLAQGQVRLTSEQGDLAVVQALNRQLLASVAAAENPAQIIAEAKKLNLVRPSTVTQLPAVPLDSPIGSSPATDAAGSSSAGR